LVLDASEATVPLSFRRLGRIDSFPKANVRGGECTLSVQVIAGIGVVGQPTLDAGARVTIKLSIHVGGEEFARQIVGRWRGHGCT
jgi:hypothetical protein